MRCIFALLLLLLASAAQAQTYTRSEAWSRCQSRAAQADAQAAAQTPPAQTGYHCKEYANDATSGAVHVMSPSGGLMGWYYFYSGTCPAGQSWNPTTHTCTLQCPNGYKEDAFNPGTCMDDAKCRALNSSLGGADRTMSGESFCPTHGCQMRVQPGTATKRNGQGGALVSGLFEYTGESCGATPANPEPPPEKIKPTPEPQECVSYPSGQKMCQKRDGQQCYTTTNGRQNCWRPGETGEKTDGPVLQKRNAGPTEIPPSNLNLPNGDTLQKSGESKTETTQQKNGATSTTTTTNYYTTNGTNAGPKNSGESGTGDGSGTEGGGGGDGGEEGEENGVSGGSCEGGYTTTGDPILGAILKETHKQRCAQDKLKAGMEAVAAAGDGDTPGGSIWDTSGTPLALNEGLISLGNGGVPTLQFDVEGVRFAPFGPEFVGVIGMLRWLIIAAATLWGLYIIWNRA